MKRVVFSERSKASLVSIFEWTLERFGQRQADEYSDTLRQACHRIALGTIMSRNCRDVFVLDLREDLRFVRAGRHVIIFVDTGREVVVIDFLHQSSDLTRRLGALGRDEAR